MSNRYTDKETISREEYQQLLGLLLLAGRHNHALREIQGAIEDITGESDPHGLGHSFDAMFGDRSADELLEKLGIEVED